MRFFLPLIISFSLFVSTLASPSAKSNTKSEWERIDDEDGIVVYKQDDPTLDIIAFRGEAIIDARVDVVTRFIADNKRAPKWMPLMVEKRVLKWITKTSRIEYSHVDFPWPFDDRYFVAHGSAEIRANNTVLLSMKSIDNPSLVEEDKVLGHFHRSVLFLKPVEAGEKTYLTVEIQTDPKGLLPKWMANIAQRSWPRDFFLGLRRELKDPQTQLFYSTDAPSDGMP